MFPRIPTSSGGMVAVDSSPLLRLPSDIADPRFMERSSINVGGQPPKLGTKVKENHRSQNECITKTVLGSRTKFSNHFELS
jgi:hypothetical protein